MSEKCPICGRNRDRSSSGSLTQWIASCVCDLGSVELEQASSLRICQNCGKRVLIGRSGSFTQWIFRHDSCSCEAPVPLQLLAEEGAADDLLSDTGTQESDEVSRVLRALSKAATTRDASSKGMFARWENQPTVDPKTFPIDRYKPINKLGSGNNGDVHLCLDRYLNKLVCVKTLHEINKDTLMLFQKEAIAMSRLRHPNIVSVLDFGIANGVAPYMVSEFFNGDSLEQLLNASGAIRWQHALAIGMEVAKALAYSHANKIFHGDIKPSNILIAETGSGQVDVRVIDFGLAQVLNQTMTGLQGVTDSLIGTPTYMCPDQARGLKYSARSEVYSLGCVLFECICGRPPFRGDSPIAVLSMHAKSVVPTFVSCGVDTPLDVEAIVMKCLTKDPSDRIRSMQLLEESIEAILRAAAASQSSQSNDLIARSEPYLVPGMPPPRHKRLSMVVTVICMFLASSVLVLVFLHRLAVPILEVKQLAPIVVPGSQQDFEDSDVAEKTQEQLLNAKLTNESDQFYDVFTAGLHGPGRISLTDAPDPESNIDGFLDSEVQSVTIWSKLWTDRGMRKLAVMKHLQTISLGYSGITDEGLKSITDLSDIRELVFSGTKITDKGIQMLSAFPKLRKLVLTKTKITDEGVKSISGFSRLEELRLEGTPITDLALGYIERLPSLKILDVKDCKSLTAKAIARYRGQHPEVELVE